MRRLVFAIAIIAASFVSPSAPADSEWQTNYKRAQQDAKAGNKLLLMEFSGSDWCGPCILLDREILSRPEFKEYANKNLVLMEVDFPRRKMQSEELKKQNQELADQYQIEVFPTILVFNGDGKLVWRFYGLYEDGPKAFIAELEKARKS